MLKSLLVLIPSEHPVRPVVDGSIHLAIACGAHLDALAIGYESNTIPMAAVGGPGVAIAFEENRQRAIERAEAAMSVFDHEAADSKISYRCRTISAIPAEAASIAGAAARVHDLTVALQPDFEQDTLDSDLSREILFQAGGPILFMPYTFRGAFAARRIGICWDGSPLAGRALPGTGPAARACPRTPQKFEEVRKTSEKSKGPKGPKRPKVRQKFAQGQAGSAPEPFRKFT